MANVLLISEVKLKNYTNLNKNIDIDYLRSEINVTQDIDLQNILGGKFYRSLLSKVNATGNTFNSDELTLVNDYIAPFLIHASYWQAIPHLHYRSMNKGLVEATNMEGGSAGVDFQTMTYLRQVQKQRADNYKQRLIDYLNIGYGLGQFPDYINYSTRDGVVPDRGDGYSPGIVLRHVSRNGYNMNKISKTMPVYSDRMMINPDCPDCW